MGISPGVLRQLGCSVMASRSVRWDMSDSQVATIRIDRPDVRNALDMQAWGELADAVARVRRASPRAVVLTGGDVFFSAGGDVKSLPGAGSQLTALAERLELVHDAIRGVVELQAPVIAAVEGFAVGAAWGLVLTCDLVVASSEAFFQAPFALRGLVADAATTWTLPRALGRQRAMRYLLLGQQLPAKEAYDLGLVSHLAKPSQVTSEALAVAGQLAAGPGESNALTKSLVVRGSHSDLTTHMEAERIAVALAGHGRDAMEGLAAYIEKRAPEFR